MPSYSNERREAVVAKLLPPRNLSVREVAQQEGIYRRFEGQGRVEEEKGGGKKRGRSD